MSIAVVASSSKLPISNFLSVHTPRTSCHSGFNASLTGLLVPGDALVLGDANTISSIWNSNIEEDQRDQVLPNEINESTFAPLNDTLIFNHYKPLSKQNHTNLVTIQTKFLSETPP